MPTTLRLLAFVPLALAASLLVGGFTVSLAEFFGGSSWYSWLVGGVASAWAFFYVAFKVAHSQSAIVKWVCVLVGGGIGALSAVGPLVTGRNPASALMGASMLLIAVHHARRPATIVAEESDRPFV